MDANTTENIQQQTFVGTPIAHRCVNHGRVHKKREFFKILFPAKNTSRRQQSMTELLSKNLRHYKFLERNMKRSGKIVSMVNESIGRMQPHTQHGDACFLKSSQDGCRPLHRLVDGQRMIKPLFVKRSQYRLPHYKGGIYTRVVCSRCYNLLGGGQRFFCRITWKSHHHLHAQRQPCRMNHTCCTKYISCGVSSPYLGQHRIVERLYSQFHSAHPSPTQNIHNFGSDVVRPRRNADGRNSSFVQIWVHKSK